MALPPRQPGEIGIDHSSFVRCRIYPTFFPCGKCRVISYLRVRLRFIAVASVARLGTCVSAFHEHGEPLFAFPQNNPQSSVGITKMNLRESIRRRPAGACDTGCPSWRPIATAPRASNTLLISFGGDTVSQAKDGAASVTIRRPAWACETCGNKPCPRATAHRTACIGSNDPGLPDTSLLGCYLVWDRFSVLVPSEQYAPIDCRLVGETGASLHVRTQEPS